MSFISNLFNGGAGNGWQASGTDIAKPTTIGQANTAYDQTQQGLTQQQAFLQALQAQGGLQNQSNVYNQLQGVANGTGPNPAMAALNNTTGQNVANQAALMAGQRGASANAGLIARQAAQQGANIQQQAVGQGAAMQANQSLNAIGQMGNIAGQQVANQAAATGAYNQFAQGAQANILNSTAQQNNAAVGMQSNMNNTQAQIAGINAQSQNKMIGGAINGASSAASALMMAQGGVVPPAEIQIAAPAAIPVIQEDPADKVKPKEAAAVAMSQGGAVQKGPRSKVGMHLNGGGNVPIVLSPGEKLLSPEQAKSVATGKESIHSTGKTVPGKAKVKGDSLANDTVPTNAQAGAFVIPKSIMEGKDPERGAAAFVRAHMSRSQHLGKDKK